MVVLVVEGRYFLLARVIRPLDHRIQWQGLAARCSEPSTSASRQCIRRHRSSSTTTAVLIQVTTVKAVAIAIHKAEQRATISLPALRFPFQGVWSVMADLMPELFINAAAHAQCKISCFLA